MGQQRVSNIALINIERAYANSVVSNDMDRIIDIFLIRIFASLISSKWKRQLFLSSFKVFLTYM